MKKLLLYALASLAVLASCSKEVSVQGGEEALQPKLVGTFNLSDIKANVSTTFTNAEARATTVVTHNATTGIVMTKLPFKDTDKAVGEGGPKLDLNPTLDEDPTIDGNQIYLITAIASDKHYGSAVLPWTYISDGNGKGHLELRRGKIDLYNRATTPAPDESTYTPSSTEQFYITAMFGGGAVLNANTAAGARVEVSPTDLGLTTLTPGTAAAQQISVPYACVWTPLTITSDNGIIGTTDAALEFKPQGSLIAIEIGNSFQSNDRSMDPKPDEIYINTRRFGNNGQFNLKDVPTGTDKHVTFAHDACSFNMNYIIPTSQQVVVPEGTDARDKTRADRRIYYTWVMGNKETIAAADDKTQVLVHATATHPDRPYSEIWETDLRNTKIPADHTYNGFRFNITGVGIEVPAADITNRKIAGGLPSTQGRGSGVTDLIYKMKTNLETSWPGMYGDLRVTLDEEPTKIGMYNPWVVSGKTDDITLKTTLLKGSIYNRHGYDLQEMEVYKDEDATKTKFKLSDQYFIGTDEDWAGVIPTTGPFYPEDAAATQTKFADGSSKTVIQWLRNVNTQIFDQKEKVRFNAATGHPYSIQTASDYVTKIVGNKRIVYGLRFKSSTPVGFSNSCTSATSLIAYATAYRYTYLADQSYQYHEGGLQIDIVYLGKEAYKPGTTTYYTPNDLANIAIFPEAAWTDANDRRNDATNTLYKGTFMKSVFLPAMGDHNPSVTVTGKTDPYTTAVMDTCPQRTVGLWSLLDKEVCSTDRLVGLEYKGYSYMGEQCKL